MLPACALAIDPNGLHPRVQGGQHIQECVIAHM